MVTSAAPWLSLAALASGAVSVYFIRYLWPYRDTPGAPFFIGTIACEALWAVSYGLALLVFDPALRWLFEIPIWLGINFIGVTFLAFALEYTGRRRLARSRWMWGLFALQALNTAVVATNPIHHLAWSGYRVDPVLGAATVSYTHGPWLFANSVGIYLAVAAGSFLLFDTFFSYGPLYRAQAVAVALSPTLPGLAFLAWLFEVGASPPLNLAPFTFPVHLGFDAYAFFRRNMFDLAPAARRASERAAIDDLGTAVVIVDTDRRIINHNAAAERLFAPESAALLGRRLDETVEAVDPAAGDQRISLDTGRGRREYAVTASELTDSAGSPVGHTLVFQDVTAELQREQRLDVLNRVLRHNLRNDLNVVQGYLDAARSRIEDESVRGMLETAETTTEGVVELGEKARRIDRAIGDDAPGGPTRVADLLAELRADLLAELRADLLAERPGEVSLRVPDDLLLSGGPRLLEGVFGNLIENGLDHAGDEPTVEVALVEHDPDARTAVFEIRDDGPGIPDHERAVLDAGEETALEHGSGLGLWFVKWGVDALGGEVAFETGVDGTVVTLRLPTAGSE